MPARDDRPPVPVQNTDGTITFVEPLPLPPRPPRGSSPNVLVQDVRWPGVPRVLSFSYPLTTGTTPSSWQIVTAPTDPAEIDVARSGDLIFTDGRRPVVLRDCVVDTITSVEDREGITYTIGGKDRRHRWRNQWGGLGGINGRYNQLDRRGKLVPWSIRSPLELARILLRELGEYLFDIDLPPGITKAEGLNLDRFLRLGENFPQTNTNPATEWDRMPPADALAWLCDQFGRIIAYQPRTNRIVIKKQGEGKKLPERNYETNSPSLSRPAAPKKIGINGAPLGLDARLYLEPVGKELDGSVVPIDDLTYAPKKDQGKKHKVSVTWSGGAPASPLFVSLEWEYPKGTKHTVNIHSTDPTMNIAARYADIAARLAANAEAAAFFTTSIAGDVMSFEAKFAGFPFTLNATMNSSDPGSYKTKTEVEGANGGRGWQSCPPPFYGVTPVEGNPTAGYPIDGPYQVVKALAEESVFKWFRVTLKDPANPAKPLSLPYFGELKRRQQIILQPTKFAQVIPMPRIAVGVDKGNPIGQGAGIANQGVLPEFYNGRSRNQAPVCFGSVWKQIGYVNWFKPREGQPVNQNTDHQERVFVDFSIELTETGDQIVKFSDHVYRYDPQNGSAYLKYPELVLETGIYVTDEDTDQVIRFTTERELEDWDSDNTQWYTHEDVAVAVKADYGQNHHWEEWEYLPGDKEHADTAAEQYLDGHERKYKKVEALTRQFIGYPAVNPDGAILQLIYTAGSGPTLVAARNNEPSPVVLSAPNRRRAELLPPDRAAGIATAAEAAKVAKLFPVR